MGKFRQKKFHVNCFSGQRISKKESSLNLFETTIKSNKKGRRKTNLPKHLREQEAKVQIFCTLACEVFRLLSNRKGRGNDKMTVPYLKFTTTYLQFFNKDVNAYDYFFALKPCKILLCTRVILISFG